MHEIWFPASAFRPLHSPWTPRLWPFLTRLRRIAHKTNRRTLAATLIFTTGGIVGLPFALTLALPFVFEENFIYRADLVAPEAKISWMVQRLVSQLCLFFSVIKCVPFFIWSEHGPDLYGTSPWYFYVNDLVLNFNCILPLALVFLPALGVTYIFDRKRLGIITSTSNQSSPFTVLSLRLAPHCIYGFAFSVYDHIKNVSNSTALMLKGEI